MPARELPAPGGATCAPEPDGATAAPEPDGATAAPGPGGAEPDWTVYVLLSARVRRTYVGITRDLDRRLAQHNGALPGGAKATRAGRPWIVGASHGPFATRGEAQRVERAIKGLRGRQRLRWPGGQNR